MRLEGNPDRQGWAERAFLELHPNCRCTTEPIGIVDFYALPVGAQLYRCVKDAKARREQETWLRYRALEQAALDAGIRPRPGL